MALPYLPRQLLSNLVNPLYSVFCILYHEPLICLMSPPCAGLPPPPYPQGRCRSHRICLICDKTKGGVSIFFTDSFDLFRYDETKAIQQYWIGIKITFKMP